MSVSKAAVLGRGASPRGEAENPVRHAARLSSEFALGQAAERRRNLGQFFTPEPIARFMAELASPSSDVRRILDPGAGAGILACALCEVLPPGSGPVHVDAFEQDPGLASLCRASLSKAKAWLAERGIDLTYSVRQSDFILANSRALTPGLFEEDSGVEYDMVISNPPYFKLPKSDPRSVAAQAIVHGQPNVYALFMAISANLLAPGGVMVTITPRSFAAGDYFRRFRRHLFARVTPDAVHVFHSRSQAFREDAVLQENVIMRSRRADAVDPHVRISSSAGIEDLGTALPRTVPLQSVVNRESPDSVMHLPLDQIDDEVLEFVRAWPLDLPRLGLSISTGPVVAFRAREFLVNGRDGQEFAPLLWLQHVKRMSVVWPLPRLSKPQYLRVRGLPRKLLIPDGSYVLLRRFSAKEERRRLVAAPLLKGELGSDFVGLENHLNYIYRSRGELLRDEAVGLAALLSSRLLDRYFRVSSGSTQVNASELRALPLPARSVLVSLGAELGREMWGPEIVEDIVAEALGIPEKLRKKLGRSD